MITFDTAERRARLAHRHHLVAPGPDVVTIAGDLVGFHSSDPATVYLSTWARLGDAAADALVAALYDERSVVRILGMRRTIFVVPVALAAIVDAACTKALAPAQRRRLIGLVEEAAMAEDPASWLAAVEADTLAALELAGEATASELTKVVPELALKLHVGAGTKWEGTIGMSTRVLFLLATDGLIVRGRPKGGWTSSAYRWAPTDSWLGAPFPALAATEARADLLRCWLRSFGPGTVTDIRWWTGWTVAQAKAALTAVDAIEVALPDGPGAAKGFVLPDDLEPVEPPDPWVALLPGLDPTVMGWKERDWYLGPHASSLFDRNGNAGPTVWSDGRVVGGWAQRADGQVVVELLEKVPAPTRKAIGSEAERLSRWLGPARVIPRFRTPLEQVLGANG